MQRWKSYWDYEKRYEEYAEYGKISLSSTRLLEHTKVTIGDALTKIVEDIRRGDKFVTGSDATDEQANMAQKRIR